MIKTEQDLMEELYESIFSGNVDEGKSDDDEEKEETDSESSEKSDKKETDDDSDEDEESDEDDESDEDEESGEEDESDEDESDEDEESSEKFGNPFGKKEKAGGAFKSQVKSLQKQYNDLLTDAFVKYAPECIEDALDEVESAFGENISDILDLAMQKLKDKILGDLGVESPEEGMMPAAAMGGFDPLAAKDKPMEISIEGE